MGRNKNIEMLRAVLILYMLLYHYRVSIPQIDLPYLFKESFGQFALIGFFVLSGYGTYCYFHSKGESARFTVYIKRRLLAILPQYYFSIFMILLLTSQVALWSGKGLIKILESVLLLQNFDTTNGINGVTWTIAVLFQLYLIAMPLYKLLQKLGVCAWLVIAAVSLALKRCIFYYIGTRGIDSFYYVVTGIRLPFTTVDLFLTGMLAAYIAVKLKNRLRGKKISNIAVMAICAGMLVLYHAGFNAYAVHTGGLWANKWTACAWHELIAIWIGGILLLLSNMDLQFESCPGRLIQFIAKYEYGIYLWHMVILGTFQTYGVSWFVSLSEKEPLLLVPVMMVIAALTGYLSTVITKGEEYRKFYRFLN